MKGFSSQKIALCAIMTATIEVGKLALSFLPNIEVVTLLIAVYSVVFGWYTLISVVAFVLIEIAVWGAGPWVVTYFIYWNFICVFFLFAKKLHLTNTLFMTLFAVILTFLFGLLSSFVDIALGGFGNFFARFAIYYARGIYFYLVHIISNAVVFVLLYKPLKIILLKFSNALKNKVTYE